MFKYAVVTCLLTLLIHFKNINGWRSFTVNLTNSTATVHSNKANLTVTINEIGSGLLNVNFTTNGEIKEPMLRIEIMLSSATSSRYDIEVMNRTIDVCKFFKNKFYEPLMQIIFEILLEYGDFPKTCPFKAKTYRIENMPVDAERLPAYLPERKGYFKIIFSTKEKELVTPATEAVIFFEIKSSSLKRFKTVKTN